MLKAVNVYLWDTFVGSASIADGSPVVRFEYSRDIRDLGVEISPYRMPLTGTVYSFPELSVKSFHGLPGLLADSLPDKFGNKVIAAYLRSRNVSPDDLTPVDRLAYAGKRGMGALEYRPAMLDSEDRDERIEVDELAALADSVLKMREDSSARLIPGMTDYAPILRVGSSAGGARAKALIGWREGTGEVRSGQVALPPEFGYWLIKFDGIAGNGDKEGDDKWGYGRVEYAYHLMAKATPTIRPGTGRARTRCPSTASAATSDLTIFSRSPRRPTSANARRGRSSTRSVRRSNPGRPSPSKRKSRTSSRRRSENGLNRCTTRFHSR